LVYIFILVEVKYEEKDEEVKRITEEKNKEIKRKNEEIKSLMEEKNEIKRKDGYWGWNEIYI
jgi:adenine-specific DNA methylase